MERPSNLIILEGISCLSFNKDRTLCVLSKKDKNLYIYKVDSILDFNKWELIHTLKSHFEYISEVDWHPETNRIISSSFDRNIYIWEYSSKHNLWKPQLVIFKSKLSILSVRWNKTGDKFCGSTGGRLIIIGYFSKEANWWKGEEIKYHKSAVTSVGFDISGLFVISGSTDLRLAIHSAYVKEIDDVKDINNNGYFDEKDFKSPIKTEILSVKTNSWINDVTFSPSGKFSFALTHDSTLIIIDNKNKTHNTVNLTINSGKKIITLSDNKVIIFTFDKEIIVYENFNGTWKLSPSKLEEILPKMLSESKQSVSTGGILDRMKQFDEKEKFKKQDISQLKSSHLSTISSANVYNNELITSDFSGYLKKWKI